MCRLHMHTAMYETVMHSNTNITRTMPTNPSFTSNKPQEHLNELTLANVGKERTSPPFHFKQNPEKLQPITPSNIPRS